MTRLTTLIAVFLLGVSSLLALVSGYYVPNLFNTSPDSFPLFPSFSPLVKKLIKKGFTSSFESFVDKRYGAMSSAPGFIVKLYPTSGNLFLQCTSDTETKLPYFDNPHLAGFTLLGGPIKSYTVSALTTLDLNHVVMDARMADIKALVRSKVIEEQPASRMSVESFYLAGTNPGIRGQSDGMCYYETGAWYNPFQVLCLRVGKLLHTFKSVAVTTYECQTYIYVPTSIYDKVISAMSESNVDQAPKRTSYLWPTVRRLFTYGT